VTKDDVDLLAIDCGAVTAPAGCGKTHLIAEALTRHAAAKPILILTHTNAGVVALRGRLDRAHVPSRAYRLSTIDGWAMRLIRTFPMRSGHDPVLLNLANPRSDYPAIRDAARRLLSSGHIDDVVAATYARLIVDEYQDCSDRQHQIVVRAAKTLPTCVLGDPMQAIFGFGNDGLANWGDIVKQFPVAGELTIPWRWHNAGSAELGRWLLEVRGKLIRREPIDLRAAPAAVSWIELSGDASADHRKQLAAALVRPPIIDGRVMIIGDSKIAESRWRIAKATPGAVTVEAVDFKDLVFFAATLDLAASDLLQKIAGFAQTVLTNVGSADLVKRVESLVRGTARKPATDVESAALRLLRSRSYSEAVDLLVEIGREPGVRAHRPTVLRACIRAFQMCEKTEGLTFYEAVISMREENRLLGRPLPKRAVGSTLLLKGLEAEVAVILNADVLNARNLYVAMTRGSMALTVCSRSPILTPRP